MANSREAIPFSEEKIGTESSLAGLQSQADASRAEADRMKNLGFFGLAREGFRQLGERREESRQALPEDSSPTFFEAKNVPDKPNEFPTGGTPENIIETGKKFFRNVGGFFNR